MPVALPSPETVELTPPTAAEAATAARGMASVVAPAGGLTHLQQVMLEAVIHAMTGHRVDLTAYAPMTPRDLAELLALRNLPFRTRIVQLTLLTALLLRPLPPDVVTRISTLASELGVDDAMVHVAEELAAGALGLAAFDFDRNGYTADWHEEDARQLHAHRRLQRPWDVSVADPELAAERAALEALAPETIGRQVWEMYQSRGFEFPGTPGSAPPLLAQHDWIHVLADYGTTVESEIEVFAFIARANDDTHAFSLLAMVVSLFETGYLRTGAGLFQSSVGHISASDAMPVRIADAMRRGSLCRDLSTGTDGIDFLRTDWFALADWPVSRVRERFCVPPKSDEARSAGSPGLRDAGGISAFQLDAGRRHAERVGRPYDPYGARLA